jgi:rubrerythrin
MKRSFTALDPQQALHVAVIIEERNAGLYQRFSEMFMEFGDPESLEIADVFWEMAIEEGRHSSLLQSKYAQQYGNLVCIITEEDLVEFIEVPKLEDGDLFADSIRHCPSARDRALHVALKAEVSAQIFYSNLAENTEPGPLRSIYQELAQTEDGHVAYLEQKLHRDPAQDQIH